MSDRDQTVTVTVFSPRTPDPKEFSWPKTMKVEDAAREAADAFGHQGGSPSLQNEEGDVLDRQKPFVAESVEDGDRLELVDVGGAV